MTAVKCAWCESREEKILMTQDKSKKYYHTYECYELFKEDKKFKEKEREELNDLTEIILEVHNLKLRASIPSSFYPYLNDLRNDSILFGKLQKRHKEGASFKLISDTYMYCKDKIMWAKANKQFQSTMAELKYGLAIVKNNIENTIKENTKKLKQESETKKLVENIDAMHLVNQRMKEFQRTNIAVVENDEVDVESLFD